MTIHNDFLSEMEKVLYYFDLSIGRGFLVLSAFFGVGDAFAEVDFEVGVFFLRIV